MMFGAELTARAAELIDICRRQKLMLASAESCTGGLIAGLITSIAGSSDAFEAGFVTYSNTAKARLLGVSPDLIAAHGAVSEEVARAMASGALQHCGADISVAVTGIAGPGGGTATKPVGLVHCAAARRNGAVIHRKLQLGAIGRDEVRMAAVSEAIGMLYALVLPGP